MGGDKKKNPKGFACGSSGAARSQSPARGSADQRAGFGQRDLGTAGGIWGRQSREPGALGCLKGHSRAQTQKKTHMSSALFGEEWVDGSEIHFFVCLF